jgi:hypothetical protein
MGDMLIERPSPGAALDVLHAALAHLRALAAVPSADPFYAGAAEQVAAIMTGIEGRVAPPQAISTQDPGASPPLHG